jgi:hypothetical protein
MRLFFVKASVLRDAFFVRDDRKGINLLKLQRKHYF